MYNIIRYWNQNRKRIITGIVAIIALILIIQILERIAKTENERRLNEASIELTEEERNLPTESIIGGTGTSLQKAKTNVSLIESFVEKCNKGDVTGAYNMLTDDCKQASYQTEQNFKDGYYTSYLY